MTSARGAAPFPLPRVMEDVRLLALELSGQDVDKELVGARLMDGFRDAGVPPLSTQAFGEATSALDAPAWQRLDLLTRVFRETDASSNVTALLRKSPERALPAFIGFPTREAQLLTIDLLLKSPFRVEELARKWINALGGSIEGESEKESRKRMERLDFGGVLKNLEAADRDREARVQKMKEIEAQRLKEQQEAYARQGRE